MESGKVKLLRKKYGVYDSRNEYTESEIMDIINRKIYYIDLNYLNIEDNNEMEYKEVIGYVTSDNTACIFIKDTITGRPECYMPVKRIDRCEEIKDGIYLDSIDKILYCTTEELEFSLDYAKQYIKEQIQEDIEEIEEQLRELQKKLKNDISYVNSNKRG